MDRNDEVESRHEGGYDVETPQRKSFIRDRCMALATDTSMPTRLRMIRIVRMARDLPPEERHQLYRDVEDILYGEVQGEVRP